MEQGRNPPASASQRKTLLWKLSVEGPSFSLTCHFPGTWAFSFQRNWQIEICKERAVVESAAPCRLCRLFLRQAPSLPLGFVSCCDKQLLWQ